MGFVLRALQDAGGNRRPLATRFEIEVKEMSAAFAGIPTGAATAR